MMQRHNGYWISGTAVPGPPYTTYWAPQASVLRQRSNGSLVELTRLAGDDFELDDNGANAFFRLELALMIVDN